MYSQKVTITYQDGSRADAVLTQWSMGQFAQYASSKGWKVDLRDPGLLSLVMLRYQAYCEIHRDPNKPRASFDKWDMTVQEVEPLDDPEQADPTNAEPSADS